MYPPPYQPPGVQQYYSAPIDPLRHARWASIFMFVIGPLILLTGTCLASVPAMMRMAPSTPENDQMVRTIREQSGGHLEVYSGAGVAAIVLGLSILILGFFVRRGGRRSCTAAAVLIGLLAVYFALNLLACLVKGNIPGVFISFLMVGMFGMIVIWLIQARSAAATIHLAQQQYAAQYWQYQQTMQAYANAGYGYGAPPQAAQPPAIQQPSQPPEASQQVP